MATDRSVFTIAFPLLGTTTSYALDKSKPMENDCHHLGRWRYDDRFLVPAAYFDPLVGRIANSVNRLTLNNSIFLANICEIIKNKDRRTIIG